MELQSRSYWFAVLVLVVMAAVFATATVKLRLKVMESPNQSVLAELLLTAKAIQSEKAWEFLGKELQRLSHSGQSYPYGKQMILQLPQ
jgi:hypothetical protein